MYAGLGRRFQRTWTRCEVFIPRCAACRRTHERLRRVRLRGGLVLLVLSLIASVLALRHLKQDEAGGVELLVSVAGVSVARFVPSWLCRLFLGGKIRFASDAKKHPDVQEKLLQGWRIGSPVPQSVWSWLAGGRIG